MFSSQYLTGVGTLLTGGFFELLNQRLGIL
jgi:hypothetical protein